MKQHTSTFPKVTIMIPTYNQARYIEQTVESALMQDYPNLEVLVSDDCSTDETPQLMYLFMADSRFRYCRSEKNRGRVGNYHHSLYELATGDWVINLDGDDYYTDSQFISRSMNRISLCENVVCYFAKKYVSPLLKKCTQNQLDEQAYFFDGKEYFKRYFQIGGFAHMGTLYRRDIAIADGKCYSLNELQSDCHGIIRYCFCGNVIIAQDSGYQWRVHDANATQSLDFYEKMQRELSVQQRIIADLPDGLTDNEQQQWLEAGRLWAENNYLSDRLHYQHDYETLFLAIKKSRFSWNYFVLLIKKVLVVLFRINLFR